ncbi:outer membrane lipoprotein-sorting protein [Marinilabiliaceae bacterium JC040]|nr:outer membrane lipoprotein-sorting protein [Marinilabiliaceae bacterium JC040]
MSKKLILFILTLTFISFSYGQDAKSILSRVNDNIQGKSNKSVIKMSIVRPSYTRTIAMKGWSLGKKYFMVYVTSPAKDKGLVVMKYENQMWQYTPSINRMIKLPPSMMSQGFMGSDYSNDDVVKQSSIVDDYDQKILKEEVVDSRDCYLIEMIPHDDSDVVWGKVHYWIDKDLYIVLKGEYYDEDGYLVRTEYGKNIKKYGDRYLPSKIIIIPNEDPENKTIIETISNSFNFPIKKRFFSQQNMKRLR